MLPTIVAGQATTGDRRARSSEEPGGGDDDVRLAGSGPAPASGPGAGPIGARRRFTLQALFPWGLGSLLSAVTLWQINQVPIYMTSDAGHYLADADALTGHGVREIRHLPVFPAVVEIPHSFLSPVVSIQVVAVMMVLGLFLAGMYFLHGRLHPVAVAFGGFVLAATPLVAEAIGWFGGSMIVGYALAIVAARALADALDERAVLPWVLAMVAGAATVATHSVPTTLLVVWSAYLVLAALVRALRAHEGAGRVLLVGGAFLGACVLSVLLNHRFYLAVEQPVQLGLDVGRLSIIWNWAFRSLPAMWIGLVLIGAIAPLLSGRRPVRQLGWLAFIATVACIAQTVLLHGDPSYTTRGLYTLVVPAGLGAGWLADRAIVAAESTGARAQRRWVVEGMALVIVGVLWSYAVGLGLSVPYYNRMDPLEMDAITWLRDHPGGTVAVGPKAGNRIEGTLYAWDIEGIGRHRAIGTGRPFLYLLTVAQDDSHDVERMFAGTTVIEDGSTRVGISDDGTSATVHVKVDKDWTPAFVADLVPSDKPGSRVRGWERDLAVNRGPGGVVTLRLRVKGGSSAVEIHPDEQIAGRVKADGTGFRVDGPSGTVGVRIDRPSGSGAPRELADPTTGASYLLFDDQSQTWTFRLSGGDRGPGRRKTFDAKTIERRQKIRYVWTWSGSLEEHVMNDRRCATPAFANGEVTIWSVDARCAS